MKVHYINILFFALPLNILVTLCHVYNKRNHNLTIHKTTTTSRLLCECELYAPVNYDNDPEMKALMQDFDRQTSQRFKEYDERTIRKKQKCKEQCDKNIQKIILKYKIEKELTEKFVTLEKNIDTNDIPTCVCEKSVADKTEKFCHNCGYGLGSVAASIGLLGGPGIYGWKIGALAAAEKAAIAEGAEAGTKAGVQFGIQYIITELKKQLGVYSIGSSALDKYVTAQTLNNPNLLIESVNNQYKFLCVIKDYNIDEPLCAAAGEKYSTAKTVIDMAIKNMVGDAKDAADALTTNVTSQTTAILKEAKTTAVETSSVTYNTAIIASVVAILIIVLVMVIIYLILRYRRKKKMKKKLQYIKLLKE